MTETRTLKNFINGEYTDSANGHLDLVNPATGEVFAASPVTDEAGVDAAYNAAEKAFETWRDSTPADRQKALIRIADALEEQRRRVHADRIGEHRQTSRAPHGRGDPDGYRPDSAFSPAQPAVWKVSPPVSTCPA